VFDGLLRNQMVLEALIAFGLGVVLVTLDAVRALRGLGGRRRFLTFADQFKLRLGFVTLAALLVALTIAVLFRSTTTGAYVMALLFAAVQTLCLILGVLVLDTLLRVPALIYGLFRGRVPHSEGAFADDQSNDR